MVRHCAQCGTSFDAKRRTAKYCGGTCRTRASRSGASSPAPSSLKPTTASTADSLPLVDETRRALETAGRLDSWLGQQAMRLAERMHSAADTGSAVASLSRELRAVMAEALAGVPAVADELDELSERRRRKASGA